MTPIMGQFSDLAHIVSTIDSRGQFLTWLIPVSLLLMTFATPRPAIAGFVVDCEASAKAYKLQGIPCYCRNGQIVCDSPSKTKAKSKSKFTSKDLNVMIMETMFESLFATDTAKDQGELAEQQEAAAKAAQQRAAAFAVQQRAADIALRQAEAELKAKEAATQAEYNEIIKNYKPLDDSQGIAFKTLDGDLETHAANARKPFDTAADSVAL